MSQPNLQEFLAQYPDTRYLDVFYADLSCVIRGKRYPVAQAEKVFSNGIMSPGGTFLLAVNGECMDPEGMGFSDGDPDELGMPLPHTLVNCPWAKLPTAQVMLGLQSLDGEPYYYEPRNVLKRVLEGFDELGVRAAVAFEPEFYLLDQKRTKKGGIQVPVGPLTGQRTGATQVYSMDDVEEFSVFIDEVIRTCEQQGIETGAISGEYAPGQFEINLMHATDLLEATDRYVMFRRAVTSTARRHGMQATFMAKPWAGQSGSGLHLHISLIDDQGNNLFDGGGEYASEACGSEMLYQAIGGLKETMADTMGILAPNANAYRRFEPNLYVPVTPSWAFENRSVAIRIPKSPGAARRIEHRVAGADANPYLTLAVLLSGIHHGISNKLEAGPPQTGNAGANPDANMPTDPETAFGVSRQSEFLNKYLGERYVKAYTSCKLNEFQAFTERNLGDIDWYL